ncbi:hypothetical protein C1645_826518 [Glomus cerebriforme]|uniref:Uncharacterized protein n=1 Tax=Glomus cerebriforme TaxID=658196 RepID=A0A397SUP2_9GLOM|nr:hypothetical protein C1645_826518 [Glomus cerebriforme]
MSTEIISNLQTQLKIYQQMFEQLENDSISAPTPIFIFRDQNNNKENNKNNNNNKLREIIKAQIAIKKSATAVTAAKNNESEAKVAEKALDKAKVIVSELERGKSIRKILKSSTVQSEKVLSSLLPERISSSLSSKFSKEQLGNIKRNIITKEKKNDRKSSLSPKRTLSSSSLRNILKEQFGN